MDGFWKFKKYLQNLMSGFYTWYQKSAQILVKKSIIWPLFAAHLLIAH